MALGHKRSLSDPVGQVRLQSFSKRLAPSETQITLQELPIGSRLLVRSRTDWRFAAVARVPEERIVLTVCSPTGRSYRLRRDKDCEIVFEGKIPILTHLENDSWRDNFASYDLRW